MSSTVLELNQDVLSTVTSWWTQRKAVSSSSQERYFQAFEKLGFPTTKQEEWKYTSVRPILQAAYQPADDRRAFWTNADFQRFPLSEIQDAYRIVLINGFVHESLSLLPAAAEAWKVELLQPGVDGPDLTMPVENGFIALNMALPGTCIRIRIPDALHVPKPLLIYHVADGTAADTWIHSRVQLEAGKGSRMSLAEIFVSAGSHATLSNVLCELDAQEAAFIDYSKIQLEETRAFHVGSAYITQAADSQVDTHVLTLEGVFVRNNLRFALAGPHGTSILNGLYMLGGSQFCDNHTRVDHAMPECLSDQLYKGILNDQSVGVFNGKIMVHKDAQKTNAYQRNVNLLLSDDATIDTKPQLEIFADDVRCTHGATAGYLNEEAVFYLRARGISEPIARRMLLIAFANEIVEKMNVEALKDPLKAYIAQKLERT